MARCTVHKGTARRCCCTWCITKSVFDSFGHPRSERSHTLRARWCGQLFINLNFFGIPRDVLPVHVALNQMPFIAFFCCLLVARLVAIFFGASAAAFTLEFLLTSSKAISYASQRLVSCLLAFRALPSFFMAFSVSQPREPCFVKPPQAQERFTWSRQ